MKELTKKYKVKLLTYCFCKVGKGRPEIRSASIRGMVREWSRLLGGKPDVIWGGIGGNASKVGLEVVVDSCFEEISALLPHKTKEQDKAKEKALAPDTSFNLKLSRLVGCSDVLWNQAKHDVENWLVLGCLGQRANRAAGSIWCEDIGIDTETRLRDYIQGLKGSIFLAGSFESASDARITASDTTENTRLFGSFKPRKPSPIKMKIVSLGEADYRILFFAQRRDLISDAEKELKSKHDDKRWVDVEFTSL